MDIYQDRIRPLFDSSTETNAQIERKLGIPPKTINKWNSTQLKSYTKFIPQIASYFHVSTDYLLGNTDDPAPTGQKEKPPAQGGEPIGPNKQALLDLVETMSDDEMGVLLEVVKATLKMRGANDR